MPLIETNKQHLESLSIEEFVNWLEVGYPNVAKRYIQSHTGLIEWLNNKYDETLWNIICKGEIVKYDCTK